ncbi:prepilin peptidase [Alkanindiges sp. WGS2144]|uniref:prepilin peptidase n=1 Tax=Alkanindiges sp. WGS2144 TaxID=3366808 RepID=UPI00375354F2
MQAFIQLLIDTPWLLLSVIAVLGLCVGSFLNVVIYRLPRMMEQEWRHECTILLNGTASAEPVALSLSKPASSCPHCQHQIRWYENIPLFSWLALRGKCSACHSKISIRYPLVELATMLASIVVVLSFGPTFKMLAALLLTWVLIALTGIDFDTQLLPDRLTLPIAGLGLAINTQSLFISPTQSIWGYVIGFLVLWLVYIVFKLVTGKEGMGYGDFKLLAALGAWLGPLMLPLIILLSSMVGAIIGLALLKIRKENLPFAFGPYLAIAGWIALIWGNNLMTLYLGGY